MVTGQQTILFGGPALCLYKALTAIKVAQEFTRAGVECVPIFWMATEDHDLAEVNQCTLTARSEVSLAAEVEGHEDAPVGELRFTSQISEAVTRAAEELGEKEIVEMLRASYLPGQTFGSAFARLLLQLFSRYGLVMCDPLDLHALVSPVYSAVVERSAELNRLVQQRGKDLELAGYHQQVKVTGSTSIAPPISCGPNSAHSAPPFTRKIDNCGSNISTTISRRSIAQSGFTAWHFWFCSSRICGKRAAPLARSALDWRCWPSFFTPVASPCAA